ncbi:DNA polymerase III, alpha subunit [Acidothermus cellulolyticus 11B]|uniref:DNA polymerase III subunit alpha n=1 Tax=Acidothermus cellulolyticus (strain ATCC 43068 / DSM 8971 / 11B) TaxID=351607 RepID=A0LTR7_ACIC1|nr:DNA polymerase III, alpha subunit [Acidothermus cellulolyticus 11B]
MPVRLTPVRWPREVRSVGGSGDRSFVHLHVHTEYSMLDGAARIKDLLAETVAMGAPAIAMTDHGNVYGAYDFYKQARACGINPIIGMEGYLAPGSRFDRRRVSLATAGPGDENAGEMYTHITLLAENTDGMHNLFRLSSLASLEGFYYKPRMDRELLATYAKGIIATTGCPSSEVNRLLQQGKYAAARQAAAEYRDIFGAENFYCELMDHGLEIERRVRDDLLRLARELRLPLLATNDLHYTYAQDWEAHEVLLCVQTGKTLADPNRFKFDAKEFYLKTPAQMRELFRDLPEACDNTLAIAERVHVEFAEGANLMPRFPVPPGETEESWLVKEVEAGLHRRFPSGVPDAYRERAEYELTVICQMGFPGYFLVVADLVRYAKENGIRVGPGRGSAAGSMVAYALGITELDPIKHKLLFERFLNPERVSMPDIDIDFDERRRGDMIRYATQKYREDHVAQIITYGTIKAKQAIKDSARVLGYPYAISDRITKLMPPALMGRDLSLAAIFDPSHPRYAEAAEFRAVYENDPDVRKIVDTARNLEGLKRQWGVHAAGVILSREPLLDVIPIQRREQDGAIITQFDMGACEALGLLKMDFLGLRNLTVLDDCLAGIKANRGIDLVLEEVPLDDPATYELLQRGETLGVFQLDGGPMRALLRSMRPDNFEDISAVLALYRPGPMGANAHIEYADRKNGRKPVEPIHPELAEPLADILDDTYGVIVYQEQVIAIAQRVAGYSLGQADLLRRAMGKKKKEILDKEYIPFSEGMRKNGYSEDAIRTLWEILVPFSDYAFNKAHTAGYGLVSYWTAYLKANYPAEYMAALLTSVKDDKEKSALYLHECRRMGIRVLPPDVNESDTNFTPRGDDIRFGLSAVRNVGENVVASIIETRRSKGRFTDFFDFLAKVEPVVCNKKVVESLIKAGAFDSLGHTRRGLLAVHAEVVDSVMETKRAHAVGQFDLFGSAADAPEAVSIVRRPISDEEWEKPVLLAAEREMLGLYVSDHPLLGVEHVLARLVDCSIAALTDDERPDGAQITIGGIVVSLTRRVTRQGSPWAVVTLEDLDGSIEVLVFPQTYERFATVLTQDAIICVRGRLNRRDDVPTVVASDIVVPDLSGAQRAPLVLQLPASRCVPPVVEKLREVLSTHPGTTEVQLALRNGNRTTILRLDDRLRVDPTPALMGDLKELLGPACFSAS